MDLYKNERTKYDVPLCHLDFGYIEKCKDVKELEKILKILRSGCEGYYPDLEKLAEKKLEALNPNSKVLRKEKPALLKNYLDKSEQEQIDAELKFWENEVRSQENSVLETVQQQADEQNLPPVRGSASNIPTSKKTAEEQARKQRRVKPRDYREWEKVDIDAELAKIDGEEPKPSNKNVLRSKTDLPDTIDASDLSEPEKLLKANREKDKGNEAFRAGDYNEALLYYKRSISVLPTAAAYNNRAQTYLKMKKWTEAYKDCNKVLDMEPNNIKALLRRAMASNGCLNYMQAKNDLVTLLHHDPENKRAKQLLAEVEKSLADQKVKGRRMVIEEVEGSDENSSDEEQPETITGKTAEMSSAEVKHRESKPVQKKAQTAKANEQSSEKDIWKEEDLFPQSTQNGDTDTSKESSHDLQAPAPSAKPSAKDTKIDLNDLDEKSTRAVQDKKICKENHDPSPAEESKVDAEVCDGKGEAVQQPTSANSMNVTPAELPEAVKQIKAEGNDLFKSGQYPESVQKYDQCIEILLREEGHHSHNLSVLYCNRAAALHKMGNCRSSINDCDNALKFEPTNIKALARRARAYEDLEKYREAYVDYRQILLLDSSVDIAQQGSTRCSQMLIKQDGTKWREKLPVAEPIIAPSISVLENYAEHSRESESCKTKHEVKSHLSKDELFEQQKNEGNSYVKKGDHNSAISCYTKCIEYCPDNIVAYTNRALCYLKTKQFDKVITDCNKALSMQKDNVKALFRRALAYKELRQYEDSVNDFKHILTIDKKNAAVRKEFAIVLREKQKFEETQTSTKKRHRVHIEEVESSESESEDEKVHHLTSSRPHDRKKYDSVKATQSSVRTGSYATQKQTNKNNKASSEQMHSPKYSTPVLAKVTPYEFMQAWISIKPQNNVQSYSSLLSQVPPCQLKTVITNKLDGHMLNMLVKCVGYLAERGNTEKAFEYLQNIPEVTRFGVVSMFMSEEDKKDVRKLLELFKKSGNNITGEQLDYVKKQYQL